MVNVAQDLIPGGGLLEFDGQFSGWRAPVNTLRGFFLVGVSFVDLAVSSLLLISLYGQLVPRLFLRDRFWTTRLVF